MELAERWAATGEPFTREDDVRLFTMIQQAGQLAAQAVQEIFAASSSSAAKRGTRLQRYYRDVAMYHGTSPRSTRPQRATWPVSTSASPTRCSRSRGS
jgi:Acyl-CoA dehydrogenase, C-terminal domain.